MSIYYIDAIRLALEEALDRDPSVFLYGQDIGGFGGAFKATKGLKEKHPDRVIDAPISEDAIAGLAIGAAIEGMRPVIEMQFADFSSIAFNQIVNNAATHFYRTGVPVPLVMRLPCGGTPGSGPFHSQNLEAIYSHYPGIKVVAPAFVSDAYSLLLEAIECDDPVIYCEHKLLYRWLRTERFRPLNLPIGKGRIVRAGKHATVVTYSAMVHEALRAADELAADGWQIEIVDLRTIKPLDTDTVLASVARTGRLLAVSEDFPFASVASEVVAQVASKGFDLLDAPPMQHNSKDTPIPYHPNLWKAHRPTAESIKISLLELLNF